MASYKGMMSGITKPIKEVAENIAGTGYWDKIAPGMDQLRKEVGEKVIQKRANAMYDSTKVNDASTFIANGILRAQKKGTDDLDELSKKIAHEINEGISDVDSLFEKYSSAFEGFPKEKIENYKNKAKSILNPDTSKVADSPEEGYKTLTTLQRLVEVPKTYFTNPDKNIRDTRILTAAGIYAGASIGTRYLSGGTLTRDSYGRNDIAGVPFI